MELRQRIRAGRPVAEFLLFMNDHEEVAAKLRCLMHALGERGVPYQGRPKFVSPPTS